jgi:anhydro-N-acetylmuramic acid kinase
MVYKVIGLMSGSSLDGLDLAYVHLQEKAVTGKGPKSWEYTLVHTACYPYSEFWRQRLAGAPGLSALEYQLLHAEYGHYLGEQVLRFIEEFGLHFQVQLIASHGHTAFHLPARRMTAQLGDGAALAAVTRINVVSDLRSMDVALGGQGAPIVPIGERWLLPGYTFFLNLGGIANVSGHGVDAAANSGAGDFVAFDVCPANRVLNSLAALEGRAFDEDGALAAGGRVDSVLLDQLNALSYYDMAWPKSLANEFGTETVLPLVLAAGLSTTDALRTYVEHIAVQVRRAVGALQPGASAASGPGAGADAEQVAGTAARLLVTGGGAHNSFLISRLREELSSIGVEIVVPEAALVDYKEALVMALIGVLRWREENNVLASVTGASRDSIGGAVYIGQEG